MNCRVCNKPLVHLLTYENMPAMAQHLSSTPEEHTVTLNLCQCTGCGLVQLDNEPVWYWNEDIRVYSEAMQERINVLQKVDFYSLHRLEHMSCPNEYLREFSGTGIVEVPNFDMILAKNLFAEIMLDHLLYFTADTLRFTLTYNGFDVQEINSVWDDYILSAVVHRRKALDLTAFKAQQAKLKANLDSYIEKYNRVAIYGASHQALAYIATLHPKVEFIVDNALFKQGKYSPVGGVPIYNPDRLIGVDAVIIMGAGYSDEILHNLNFDGGIAVMRNWGLEVIK